MTVDREFMNLSRHKTGEKPEDYMISYASKEEIEKGKRKCTSAQLLELLNYLENLHQTKIHVKILISFILL